MNHNLGANIRVYRKNKGFTQEELANLLGVTPQAVSRWESEAGLPDIGLIIPMAQILGVTTDALFGYDKMNQDEAVTNGILEYVKGLHDEGDRWGSSLKICEYLSGESTKNPTNYRIQIEFVQQIAHLSMLVDLEGFLKEEPQRYQKLYEDGIQKGIQVIRYCNDHQLIDKAHYALAWIYIHKQDYDNAREHINVLPSLASNRVKESINMELTFFEKGFEEMKDVIVENSKILFGVFCKHLCMISENYAYFGEKEEALRICKWGEQLVDIYAQNERFMDTAVYYEFGKKIALYKMVAYSRAGEKEKADEIYRGYLDKIKQKANLSEEEYEKIVYFLDCQKKGL
ncbi:MAG: helix-turn-helix transcriptional regulator [Lachnospiraceae bacterium]|nr:helix-turn-helix transcriptional regulator [Lachnospiraceae bacterium]